MRSLGIDELAGGGSIQFLGAPDLDIRADGIGPRGFPAWTRPQIPDLLMDAMVSMGSGVRLRFRTDSDVIELDAAVTCFRYVDSAAPDQVVQLLLDTSDTGTGQLAPIDAVATQPSMFVLNADDPADVGFEVGGTDTFRFEGLGARTKVCELWLPHGGTVRIKELRVDDGATFDTAGPTGKPRWIHYGSSISHCMEAEVPTGVWPAVAAQIAGVELRSLGLAGQCMLDQFVARTIRDEPADVISLKLGINIVNGDTIRERTFVPAVNGFLDTVRDGHPDTPLLIVSPIFCPSAETVPGPTIKVGTGFTTLTGHDEIRQGCLTLVRIRELLAAVVETRRALGDTNLHYLDGLQLFGPADEPDLPDALHPNAAGYRRMGERFAAMAFHPEGPFAPMKAAVYYEVGGPDVFRYEDVPDPVVHPKGVIVQVAVIGIQGGDTLNRGGGALASVPHIVGYQAAGTVVDVGVAVTSLAVGQRVVVTTPFGSHAELVAVPATSAWVIPDALTFDQAAGIPIEFGTASDCLFEFGHLRAGQTVLIQAGAGGVGLAAIQLAKAAGAALILATASSDDRLDRLREYGLDHGINYAAVDVPSTVRTLTDGRGVDLVVDPVGGRTLSGSVQSLAYRGRVSWVGNAGRENEAVHIETLMGINGSVHGVFLGAELALQPERTRPMIADLIDRVAAGELTVVTDRVFPLAEAEGAHRYIESRQAFGRVLLHP